MTRRGYLYLALAATALALFVVVLGAYVRLNDAGLGCPDWPGCYGQVTVPETSHAIAQAEHAYPDRPVVPAKGWKEMIHRYFAGTLGLLIAALAIWAWIDRRRAGQPVALPTALVGVVMFQAVLGMWTVTWQLKPLVVMGHLLGGMTTLALLWWLTIRQGHLLRPDPAPDQMRLRPWALVLLVVVVCQIALGGWTSSNYAALACVGFPACNGHWLPHTDFSQAFVLWHGLGINYEYGILDNPARVAIQLTHRIGAVITFAAVFAMAVAVWSRRSGALARRVAAVMAVVVVIQFLLGVGNVVLDLPLPVAVAHNGVAALLLLSVVTLNHSLRPKEARPQVSFNEQHQHG